MQINVWDAKFIRKRVVKFIRCKTYERYQVDLVENFKELNSINRFPYLLTYFDYLSTYAWAMPIGNKEAIRLPS